MSRFTSAARRPLSAARSLGFGVLAVVALVAVGCGEDAAAQDAQVEAREGPQGAMDDAVEPRVGDAIAADMGDGPRTLVGPPDGALNLPPTNEIDFADPDEMWTPGERRGANIQIDACGAMFNQYESARGVCYDARDEADAMAGDDAGPGDDGASDQLDLSREIEQSCLQLDAMVDAVETLRQGGAHMADGVAGGFDIALAEADEALDMALEGAQMGNDRALDVAESLLDAMDDMEDAQILTDRCAEDAPEIVLH